MQVEISLGSDTTIDGNTSETDLPTINIWSRNSDVEIQPPGTGEADVRAAEHLAWVANWYARQMRTIVARHQRRLTEATDSATGGAPPQGEPNLSCPVWCDTDSCTAQAGGAHVSAPATVDTRADPRRSVAIRLSQTPGHRPVVVMAVREPDTAASSAADPDDYVNMFALHQAEQLWQAWGWLLDAVKVSPRPRADAGLRERTTR